MRALLLSLPLWLLLAFTGCSGSALPAQALAPAAPRAVQDEVPPPVDPNPEGWAGHNVQMPVQSGGPTSVYTPHDGSPLRILTLGDGSWAVYGFNTLPGQRLASVQVRTQAAAEGETPGEYFVGLQLFTGHRWQWFGPFAAGDEPSFGDSHPEFKPEWWWWFKGNARVAVWCTKETTMHGVDFVYRDK